MINGVHRILPSGGLLLVTACHLQPNGSGSGRNDASRDPGRLEFMLRTRFTRVEVISKSPQSESPAERASFPEVGSIPGRALVETPGASVGEESGADPGEVLLGAYK